MTVRISKGTSAGVAVVAVFFVLLLAFSPQARAFTDGQTATTVIGQSNFTSGTTNNGGSYAAGAADGLFEARDIAFDSSGDLWVADTNNNRVIEFVPGSSGCSAGVLCSDMSASLVIGQKSMTANLVNEGNGGTANSSSMYYPYDIAFDSHGNLWVVDSFNSRVLEFAYPFSNGEAASVVIGQSSFAGASENEEGSISGSGLSEPTALAFDGSGDLWVTDRGNSRVLEYVPGTSGCTAGQLCTGMSANLVIGQSVLTSGTPGYLTAKGLYEPYGLAFAPNGGLWVEDSDDGRVLGYPTPLVTDESATVVLSDPTFTTDTGSLCHPEAVNASSLCGSEDMTFDASGDLWISDSFNNRVLEFVPGSGSCTAGKLCDNMPASVVIGQAAFTTSGAATTATGLNDPYGLAFDPSGNLWVSDYNNNRILEYQGSASTTSTTTSTTSTTTTTTTTSSTTTTTTSSSSTGLGVAGPPACPSTFGGTLMPVGATFTDQAGNTWVAPGGSINGGAYSSYFFPGLPNSVPPPMVQGWGGDYGTYDGQQGWIVSFYCAS